VRGNKIIAQKNEIAIIKKTIKGIELSILDIVNDRFILTISDIETTFSRK